MAEEYAAQHAPRTQSQLSDEVRQNLASADQVLEESPPPLAGDGKQVFGGVNQAIAKLSGNRFSPKTLALAGGGLLVVLIILFGVKQCASDDENAPAPAAGSAALSTERQLLYDNPPDAYLVKSGEIEVEK